jgi:hypothetical protein
MSFTKKKTSESAHDLLSRESPLDVFFKPENVAVIGATRQSAASGGRLWNLISTPFGGTVFPVNLKRSSVLGIAYSSIRDVLADLAVITAAGASWASFATAPPWRARRHRHLRRLSGARLEGEKLQRQVKEEARRAESASSDQTASA